jgi:hypothetical protein
MVQRGVRVRGPALLEQQMERRSERPPEATSGRASAMFAARLAITPTLSDPHARAHRAARRGGA